MTKYHSVNLSLWDSQTDKLKSAAKNTTGITLRLSSEKVGNVTKLIVCIIYD